MSHSLSLNDEVKVDSILCVINASHAVMHGKDLIYGGTGIAIDSRVCAVDQETVQTLRSP